MSDHQHHLQKRLRAKIAMALLKELQRRPTDEELHRFIRVLLGVN
jgi:hypothetical protein